jgi:hypothetical protein
MVKQVEAAPEGAGAEGVMRVAAEESYGCHDQPGRGPPL